MSRLIPLVSFLVAVGAFTVFCFYLRSQFRIARVYPLYAVRDQLVFLAASGKLKEDDFLFNEFYETINWLIPIGKKPTLKRLIKKMIELREMGVDLAKDEEVLRIKRALEEVKDVEVKEAVVMYYVTVMNLLTANSLALLIAEKFGEKWGEYMPRFTNEQKRAWSVFSQYHKARSAFGYC